MKQIINKEVYNTQGVNVKKIAEKWNEYFLHYKGGTMSAYAKYEGNGSWVEDEGLTIIEIDEVKELLEKWGNIEAFELLTVNN